MFLSRTDAGKKLAQKLLSEKHSADLVLGLAHGGVVISSAIAELLDIPQDMLIVKKIGSPGNPELAIGATVPEGQRIDVSGKTVMIVDDGIATGETIKAAISWVHRHGARKVIVAVPVAPSEAVSELRLLASDVIVLETPADFGAVGEFYKKFPQLNDADMVKLLA